MEIKYNLQLILQTNKSKELVYNQKDMYVIGLLSTVNYFMSTRDILKLVNSHIDRFTTYKALSLQLKRLAKEGVLLVEIEKCKPVYKLKSFNSSISITLETLNIFIKEDTHMNVLKCYLIMRYVSDRTSSPHLSELKKEYIAEKLGVRLHEVTKCYSCLTNQVNVIKLVAIKAHKVKLYKYLAY